MTVRMLIAAIASVVIYSIAKPVFYEKLLQRQVETVITNGLAESERRLASGDWRGALTASEFARTGVPESSLDKDGARDNASTLGLLSALGPWVVLLVMTKRSARRQNLHDAPG